MHSADFPSSGEVCCVSRDHREVIQQGNGSDLLVDGVVGIGHPIAVILQHLLWRLMWMAVLAGSPSQESRIERESLIADDAYELRFWMPRIEQKVAFDRDDCGRHVQSRSASAREPRRPE